MREGYYDYMLRRNREEDIKMSIKDKYVVVDAIATYRMRYVVSMEELQKENLDMTVDPEWALDAVTCEDVEEFSQKYLGEQILEHYVVEEDAILDIFDRDNDYLKEWTREQKLEHIKRSLIRNNNNGDLYD
jgi:hypothetical protein|tara:strand:- start:73 stop:465 length:393 start_codon:yes stop_codon:yes gene_type:complete